MCCVIFIYFDVFRNLKMATALAETLFYKQTLEISFNRPSNAKNCRAFFLFLLCSFRVLTLKLLNLGMICTVPDIFISATAL